MDACNSALIELNDERDELDQALHDIVMFEHRKASGVPQQVDDDESSIALEDEVEGNDESSIPVSGEVKVSMNV